MKRQAMLYVIAFAGPLLALGLLCALQAVEGRVLTDESDHAADMPGFPVAADSEPAPAD
jgi:hypothetical protein